jgi:hypothetical protein
MAPEADHDRRVGHRTEGHRSAARPESFDLVSYGYFTDVLERLPTASHIDELVPHRWIPPAN